MELRCSKFDTAYVACSTLFRGVFMKGRCQLIKTFVNKEVTCYFSPIPCLFVINSVILSLQLNRDI